jgi:two-component system chemotaxis response regulator CheY
MKALIVEDDYASRAILLRLLQPYGEVQVTVNGEDAIAAFASARGTGHPFDLVCLDIMLPGKDGQSVLRAIRALESSEAAGAHKPARVIMTTALNDRTNVVDAIVNCDAYLVKPIDSKVLKSRLIEFGLAPDPAGPSK